MLQSSQPTGHRLQILVKFSVSRWKQASEQRNQQTEDRQLKLSADSRSLVLGVWGGKGASQCSHADQLPPATSRFNPPYGCVGGLARSGSRGLARGGGGSGSSPRGPCAARCTFRGARGKRTSFFPVAGATGRLHQTLPSCKLLVPLQPLSKTGQRG